jgi:Family of unknown function (DUF6293)
MVHNISPWIETYKKIIKEVEEQEGKNVHIYINVLTGSKVSSNAGTLACMIWKGTPYYAHIDYNDKKDPADDLPDEDVSAIDEYPYILLISQNQSLLLF